MITKKEKGSEKNNGSVYFLFADSELGNRWRCAWDFVLAFIFQKGEPAAIAYVSMTKIKNVRFQGLRRQRDNHFRTNDVEYEFMARECYDSHVSIAERTRHQWFAEGWAKRLEDLRRKQRAAGILDQEFLHPQIIKSLIKIRQQHKKAA